VLVTALCLSSAGCDTGAASPATSAPPAAPVSATPASGTSNPDDPATTGIPAGALLQPSDVRGAEAEPLGNGELAHLRPLRPCGDDPYPSDGSRRDAVAVRYVLEPEPGDAPSVVAQFIGLHAPGGAAAQFDDMTDALRRCPGKLAEGRRRWTVLDTGLAGDQSALVRVDQRIRYSDEGPKTVSSYAALARVDDAVVVVADLGWEATGGSEKLVRELIGTAVRRVG
jgi:hypothetical protein